MARIQVPFVGEAVRRLFRVVGPYTPVLEESINPVLVVGDVSLEAAPAVSLTGIASLVEAAVAAEFSQFRFIAPPGVVAKILAFTFWPAASTNLLVSFAPVVAALPDTADRAHTDKRLITLAALSAGDAARGLACTLTGDSAAALPADTHGVFRALTTLPMRFEPKHWVIAGESPGLGAAVDFVYELANTTAMFSIEWAEYPLI